MTKTNSLTGATLTDHTVDTSAGIVAGFLVRKHGRDLGHVWTQGGVWHWRSASGRNFGERQKKHAAVQALLDAFAFYAAQRALPLDGTDTPAPARSPLSGAHTRPSAPATPAPRKQEIVWGAASTLTSDEVAAAFKKAGAK